MNPVRLLPMTRIAVVALLALKGTAMVLGAGVPVMPQSPAGHTVQPGGDDADDLITGAATPKPAETEPAKKPAGEKEPAAPTPAPGTPGAQSGPLPSDSPATRELLESLQQRRQELEARAREINLRESLVRAAERRIEARIAELKAIEERIAAAEARQSEAEKAKMKDLVTMYEAMKPKDAARIFDRLDLAVIIPVVDLMNPRKVADVMAQMQPEAAERLTTELATRSRQRPTPAAGPAELPKIEPKRLPSG